MPLKDILYLRQIYLEEKYINIQQQKQIFLKENGIFAFIYYEKDK